TEGGPRSGKFRIHASPPRVADVQLDYFIHGSADFQKDFTATDGEGRTLEKTGSLWLRRSHGSGEVLVHIVDDELVEDSEDVSIQLWQRSPGVEEPSGGKLPMA